MTWNLTGLFLGAGASYEVGMPLVWELTTEVRRELAPDKLRKYNAGQHRLRPDGGYPDQLIEELASMIVRDDMHYENMLGHLETQMRRPETRAFHQHYHGLYSIFVEIVSHRLSDRHTVNPQFLRSRLRFLSGITHFVANNAPLWIFSLNHDLVVECLAAQYQFPLNCGFPSGITSIPRLNDAGIKIGDLRAETISVEDLEKAQAQFFQPGTQGINLLKVHGALDVFAFRNGKDFLKLLPLGPGVEGVLDALRAVNSEVFDPKIRANKVHTINEIAYLEDDGTPGFLRRSLLAGAFKFDTRRDQVLSRKFLDLFRFNLNYLSKLVCVGYSFGDTHINSVIREWLEFTATRTLEIVDPSIKAIPGFLMHVAPQVAIATTTTTEYLDAAAGIVRTREERIHKRFSMWARNQPGNRSGDFQAFMHERMVANATRVAHRLSALAGPDGTLDTSGLSVEEFGRRLAEEMTPSLEDEFEAFLDARKNDAKKKPFDEVLAWRLAHQTPEDDALWEKWMKEPYEAYKAARESSDEAAMRAAEERLATKLLFL